MYQKDLKTSKGHTEYFTGVAFVSFETESMKDSFVRFWTPKYLHKLLPFLNKLTLNNNKIDVKVACEPSDVKWEH